MTGKLIGEIVHSRTTTVQSEDDIRIHSPLIAVRSFNYFRKRTIAKRTSAKGRKMRIRSAAKIIRSNYANGGS